MEDLYLRLAENGLNSVDVCVPFDYSSMSMEQVLYHTIMGDVALRKRFPVDELYFGAEINRVPCRFVEGEEYDYVPTGFIKPEGYSDTLCVDSKLVIPHGNLLGVYANMFHVGVGG